ncbi:hypothetical protein [Deinococcus fonticola]|uniref:hypothetical protein n=1 Tax=Deinococcus fonticola TaxID=2528713 RepID=UPI00107572BC|nr:hypothetical protein [Deinococcus fonticola]
MLATLILATALTVGGAPDPTPQAVKCRPALEVVGRKTLGPTGSDLGQERVIVTARPGCPTQLVRLRTRNGGIVPPLGYWRIGGGYPLRLSYWVLRGARAEWRAAPNVWMPIPTEVL